MEKQQLALLGGAAGLGAGIMYLLDPGAGRRRRALVREKGVHAWHVSSEALRKSSRDLGNRSRGLVAETRSKLHREDVEDPVLCERLRAKLGRWVSHPGAIQVESQDGHVTLRGQVLGSEIDHLLKRVGKVKGVKSLDCELETHESAEGVPSLQNGSHQRRAQLPPAARLLAGTAGGALAFAGLKRRDKIGACLSSMGLSLLATSGLGGGMASRLLRRGGNVSLQGSEAQG